MKKAMLMLLLGLCVLALAACDSATEEHFSLANSASDYQPAALPSTSPEPAIAAVNTGYDFDTGDYDPASEEDFSDFEEPEEPEPTMILTPVPTSTPVVINSQYAGATPLVIDPIDKPSPSPAPSVTYGEGSFATYDATRLRISFEAPAGWDVDDTVNDSYIISNPDARMSFPAQLMVTSRAVSTSYSVNDLKREVLNVAKTIKSEYTKFNQSNTAERTLFDAKGVYLDFDALIKGTEIKVWGRIHAVYVNKTLVVVRLTAPYDYKTLYKDTVYRHFRNTLKFSR